MDIIFCIWVVMLIFLKFVIRVNKFKLKGNKQTLKNDRASDDPRRYIANKNLELSLRC